MWVVALAGPARGEFENPKAKKPPRAKPQRISAAEGVPPLPLPATPLRRSERKRQPSPPALVGMINFSESRRKMVEGSPQRVPAFPTTQIDIEKLMWYANRRLQIRYRYMYTSLDAFSWDPTELPLLYLTGWTPIPELSDAVIQRLRRFLYDGGTLVLHAQCGRPEFNGSARRLVQRIFPRRTLDRIDSDSPLYSAYFPIDTMRVRNGSNPFARNRPALEAVYVGCRPAIIFSPIDLNCGWDVVRHPIEGGILYHQDDALRLGVNVITATLANFQYARSFGTEKVYPEQRRQTRDELVIAQIRHGGDWDPTPHALPNLMKYIQSNTTLNVQFKRVVVEPANVDIFKHPVLYLTGLRGFRFSKEEVSRLRSYLAGGGVLIADAAAGRKAFDAAFRREIQRVVPAGRLEVLDLASGVYQMPFRIRAVTYSALVKAQQPQLNAPTLEGIEIDGQIAVIYSSLSLSNGWEQLGFAYNRGYGDRDAVRLGVNIIAYALTH
jgi:hypothetical protein